VNTALVIVALLHTEVKAVPVPIIRLNTLLVLTVVIAKPVPVRVIGKAILGQSERALVPSPLPHRPEELTEVILTQTQKEKQKHKTQTQTQKRMKMNMSIRVRMSMSMNMSMRMSMSMSIRVRVSD